MKIVVLGAGALGSIAAAHLARAGVDVALIARGPRAKLLAERGVSVKGISEFTVKVPIVERPQELDACDAFMLTAKTYDTQSALEGVRKLKADMAFSVQNGVVKNEHLAAVFGWPHTLGCIANFSGEVNEDGSVLFSRNEGLYLGELPGGSSERVDALVAALDDAGIRTIASDAIQSVEWSKYATWLGLTAVAVLSRLYTHVLYQDHDLNVLQIDADPRGGAPGGSVRRAADGPRRPDLPEDDGDGRDRRVRRGAGKGGRGDGGARHDDAPHVGAAGRAARPAARGRRDVRLRGAAGRRAGRGDAGAGGVLQADSGD